MHISVQSDFQWMYLFIDLFSHYLLNIYYIPFTLLDTRDMSKVLFFLFFVTFFFNLKDAQFSLKDIHSNHVLSTYCIECCACIISFNPHNNRVGKLLLLCQLNKWEDRRSEQLRGLPSIAEIIVARLGLGPTCDQLQHSWPSPLLWLLRDGSCRESLWLSASCLEHTVVWRKCSEDLEDGVRHSARKAHKFLWFGISTRVALVK